PPFHHQAVTGQALLEPALHLTVVVRSVKASDSAQANNVKVRVLRPERIKGPLDKVDAGSKRLTSLRHLQRPAQSSVFMRAQNPQGERVIIAVGAMPGRQ